MKITYQDITFEFSPIGGLQEILSFFKNSKRAEDKFKETKDFMNNNRGKLGQLAKFYYLAQDMSLLAGDIPLLVKEGWHKKELIPIQDVKLVFTSDCEVRKTYSERNLPRKGTYVSNLIDLLYGGDEKTSPVRPGLCYRLVNCNDEHELTFSTCDYYDYLNSCEYLMYSFVYNLLTKNIVSKHGAAEGNIDIKIDRKCDPFDFSNRFMVAGTNTLLVFLGKEPLMYVHRRSKKTVAEAVNVKHVVPAGTFQPIHEDDSNHEQDFSLYANVMREFGEELYGDSELALPLGQMENIFERPSIKPYHHLVQKGLGKVFYAGFGLDCLTLKPEIMTLMVFNNEEFESFFGGLNFKPNDEGMPFAVPFNQKNLLKYVKDIEMLPAGVGCMHKAYENYDFIVNCL